MIVMRHWTHLFQTTGRRADSPLSHENIDAASFLKRVIFQPEIVAAVVAAIGLHMKNEFLASDKDDDDLGDIFAISGAYNVR